MMMRLEMDGKRSSPYGILEEDIYMWHMHNFVPLENESLECKLRWFIYRENLACKIWNMQGFAMM